MTVQEDWITRLRGDAGQRDAALSELRRVIRQKLVRAIAHGDDAFIEDVIQDSLIKIMDKISEFRGRSRFTTWALTIAIRTAFSELRRKRWKDVSLNQVLETDAASRIHHHSADSEPGRSVAGRQIVADLHSIIRTKLTDRQKRALLAELAGMPQEQIVQQLDSTRNAVYKLTHDARKRVKKELEALGYSREDLDALRAEP